MTLTSPFPMRGPTCLPETRESLTVAEGTLAPPACGQPLLRVVVNHPKLQLWTGRWDRKTKNDTVTKGHEAPAVTQTQGVGEN